MTDPLTDEGIQTIKDDLKSFGFSRSRFVIEQLLGRVDADREKLVARDAEIERLKKQLYAVGEEYRWKLFDLSRGGD